MGRRRARLFLLLALATAGCAGGSDDACLTDLNPDCAVLYPPTFERVFGQTLEPTCGMGGPSCHAPEGHQAGLIFADIDEAHRLLLDGRVEPGNPACSLVMRRLDSTDVSYQMPPGRRLSAEERCSIQKWIEDGAMP